MSDEQTSEARTGRWEYDPQAKATPDVPSKEETTGYNAGLATAILVLRDMDDMTDDEHSGRFYEATEEAGKRIRKHLR